MTSFKSNKGFATVAVLIVVCVVVGVGAIFVTKKNDSVPEQLAEEVLKSQTGIDIDFSPDDSKAD